MVKERKSSKKLFKKLQILEAGLKKSQHQWGDRVGKNVKEICLAGIK